MYLNKNLTIPLFVNWLFYGYTILKSNPVKGFFSLLLDIVCRYISVFIFLLPIKIIYLAINNSLGENLSLYAIEINVDVLIFTLFLVWVIFYASLPFLRNVSQEAFLDIYKKNKSAIRVKDELDVCFNAMSDIILVVIFFIIVFFVNIYLFCCLVILFSIFSYHIHKKYFL